MGHMHAHGCEHSVTVEYHAYIARHSNLSGQAARAFCCHGAVLWALRNQLSIFRSGPSHDHLGASRQDYSACKIRNGFPKRRSLPFHFKIFCQPFPPVEKGPGL